MADEQGAAKLKPPGSYKGFFPFYWTFRLSLRILYRLLWRWRIFGKEKMPPDGPVIVASNHASYLDPTILGSVFDRPTGFMARRSLFKNWFFSFLIGKLYAFPLDREGDPRSALRTMGERLQRGECVVMFPEGTRTRDGHLGPMKRGAGMLAARNMATVLPVYIGGAFQSWPRTAKRPTPYPLRIEVGDPLVVDPEAANERSVAKAEERRIQADVERQLHEMEARYFEVAGPSADSAAPAPSEDEAEHP